ncbi:MAG: hypothetical protein ACFFG0_00185 [Candidatus Thorarchaeota archaeon]
MKIEKVDQNINSKELLPQIVDRIYSICKLDPSFHLKNELEIIENKMASIKQKIEKQDDLLKQSEELKADLIQRIEILDQHNENKQMELLEAIGSEL